MRRVVGAVFVLLFATTVAQRNRQQSLCRSGVKLFAYLWSKDNFQVHFMNQLQVKLISVAVVWKPVAGVLSYIWVHLPGPVT